MHHRRIVRKKIIVRGGGIQDVILEYTKHGIQYLKRQTVDGVRRLVPYAESLGTSLGNAGIDKVSNAVGLRNPQIIAGLKAGNSSAVHRLGELVEMNMHEKMGGRVKPTRNLILREINHALRHA